MLVSDTIHGTVADYEERRVEYVRLSATERKRSRVRTETEAGTEIGLQLDRAPAAGDVVHVEAERVMAVVFEDRPALELDLSGVEGDGSTRATLLELGHFLGNRHRDLAVEGARAYVPVETEASIAAAVRERLPDGARVEQTSVSPALFDDGGTPDHGHAHGADDGDAGGHDHTHANGHDDGHERAAHDHSHVHPAQNGGHEHDGDDDHGTAESGAER